MSDEIGPISVLPAEGNGPFLPGAAESSPQTQWLVDQAVTRLIDEAHVEVTKLLTDHRDQLESLARALLTAETLDTANAYAAAQVPAHVAEPTPTPTHGGGA
jgi:cell division protease FtsH